LPEHGKPVNQRVKPIFPIKTSSEYFEYFY
jgi:hypothetical protein